MGKYSIVRNDNRTVSQELHIQSIHLKEEDRARPTVPEMWAVRAKTPIPPPHNDSDNDD